MEIRISHLWLRLLQLTLFFYDLVIIGGVCTPQLLSIDKVNNRINDRSIRRKQHDTVQNNVYLGQKRFSSPVTSVSSLVQ